MTAAYNIFSVGDSAICIDLGSRIDSDLNDRVLSIKNWLVQNPFTGMRDLVIGYSSLTIYYDPLSVLKKYQTKTAYCLVKEKLVEAFEKATEYSTVEGKLHRIPVCYDSEFGTDLDAMASQKNISVSDIISIHCSITYRVFMIGFIPGFPYLGEVPPSLQTPRKLQPQMVAPGSVGIAGKQTGIYPFSSPGGWNIVGRTPISLFDHKNNPPALLEAGDRVEFFSISKEEFDSLSIK